AAVEELQGPVSQVDEAPLLIQGVVIVELQDVRSVVRRGIRNVEDQPTVAIQQIVSSAAESENQPLLVPAAVVGPLNQLRSVGERGAGDVQQKAAVEVEELVITGGVKADGPGVSDAREDVGGDRPRLGGRSEDTVDDVAWWQRHQILAG